MRNPFKPAAETPAPAARQKETPALAPEYPGINLDVCRQRIARGEPVEDVAAWLVWIYPGYFPDVETAKAAL